MTLSLKPLSPHLSWSQTKDLREIRWFALLSRYKIFHHQSSKEAAWRRPRAPARWNDMVSDIIYREVTLAAKPMPGDTYNGVLKVYTESANDSALDEIWVPISSSSSDQAMREADRLRVRLGIKSIGAEEPPSLSLSAPKGLRDRPLSDFLKALSDRLAAYKARRSA